MKITDLKIDPRSLGSKLWLVDVSPAYEYQNNRRTDTIIGYRYTVAMPEKGLDKILKKVGEECTEVFIYWSQGQPQVGAKAAGIHLVDPKP